MAIHRIATYSAKLTRFNAFANAELRHAIATLSIQCGMRVLDAGCGSGEALKLFSEAVGDEGAVVGIDLATAHAAAARLTAPPRALVLQGDLLKPPLKAATFDLMIGVLTSQNAFEEH